MKNIAILLSIIALSLNSCKNSDSKTKISESEEIPATVEVKKVKTPEELEEEGNMVRAELKAYFNEIPESFKFKESLVNAMGVRKSVFIAENVNEEAKKQLDKWVQEQSKELVNKNWEKIVLRDNEMISGMLYNSYSFKKLQGGESSLKDIVSLTSVYNTEKETYTIFVKPYTV